ncbi:DUF1574 domain-containing protein [Gramella sp. AN32]|uniref:DUF1574 domain-containing protein n=1 Tax=Christiangramia antarctica TaxID=2058158 RepID=A0ABW5X852_9FLAO|nr:DUF1574 domain-containing protein [Gramella sp. AN32]MCM4154424.1 hypothetical protein [Gramella sp. AN32]
MKKILLTCLIFSTPIIMVLVGLEITLRNIDLETKVKAEFIDNNKSNIKIAVLGSSQTERAINPEFLDYYTINFSNSSQRIPENYLLLKKFYKELRALQLIVLELPYDMIYRDKEYTSKIVDQQNLIFYDVNTFQRDIKPWDYQLYPSNPQYLWSRIKNFYLDKQEITPNAYGFDTNHFFGSYQAINHNDSLIFDKDIFIENANNKEALQPNLKVLNKFLKLCAEENFQVLLYSPPNHYRYNNLKDVHITSVRDSLVQNIQDEYPTILFFNEELNPSYTSKYFFNANHLNPDGAKKATKELNDFILDHYSLK